MDIRTHHIGETIMIGEGLAVTILGVHGGQVRMGVFTPDEVAVNREANFKHVARDTMRADTAVSEACRFSTFPR